MSTQGSLLDGEIIVWGEHREVRSPFDGSVVGEVVHATREDAERAVAAAVRAFEVTKKLPAYERARVAREVSSQLRAQREELAKLLAREAGKPVKTARAEVDRAAFTFEVAAEEAGRIYGEVLPLDLQEAARGRWGMVRRFPIGAIAAITPFNFPLNLPAHKIAPAIACGCTMVLKPAPQDPLSTLALAEIVHNAGWPAGALNVLPLSNEDAGVLVEDERIKLLTFTGSTRVGWELRRRAGNKRVALELGGNAAVVVHSDADLEHAAARCVSGAFGYSGQSCISVQRIYVERGVFDRFCDLFLDGARKLKTGDPLDEATDVGPMISEAEALRAEEWVNEALDRGARSLLGGERKGTLIPPTILTGTSPKMRVNCMEVFAPVVTLEPYDQFDEALAMVNDSPYGLQAGVFTHDARLIFRAYEELEVGGVLAGDIPSWRIDHMPYGGWKQSGTGREGVRYSIEEMTDRKLLVMAG